MRLEIILMRVPGSRRLADRLLDEVRQARLAAHQRALSARAQNLMFFAALVTGYGQNFPETHFGMQ